MPSQEAAERRRVIEQLVLVRHGETVHNVSGIAQGWNDSELSARGRTQIAALAARLSDMKLDAIYSSPLQRAHTTAEAIAAATGLEIIDDPGLREMSYGQWEGKSFLDVRRDDPEGYRQWISDSDSKCPGGESHSDLHSRLAASLQRIRDGTGRRPVVVTHGTAIRVAVTILLDLPLLSAHRFAQDNAAIDLFVWRRDHYVLKLWNDATHLSAP